MEKNKLIMMDLKPENILFKSKSSNDIVIVDLHKVRAAVKDEELQVIEGQLPSAQNTERIQSSPYYVAPEVLEKKPCYKSDMWSLGCIAYVMFTHGIPPFNGRCDAEILAKIRLGKYSEETLVDCGVSEDVIRFVSECLQVDPEKRLGPQQALKHEWIQANRTELEID